MVPGQWWYFSLRFQIDVPRIFSAVAPPRNLIFIFVQPVRYSIYNLRVSFQKCQLSGTLLVIFLLVVSYFFRLIKVEQTDNKQEK